MKSKVHMFPRSLVSLLLASSLVCIQAQAANDSYRVITESSLIGANLKSHIKSLKDDNSLIDVEIALVRDPDADNYENQKTEVSISDEGEITLWINDQKLEDDEIDSFYIEEKKQRKDRREKLRGKSASVANRFVQKMKWLKEGDIEKQIEGGKRTLSVQLTAKEIQKILKKVPDLLLSIDLKIDTTNNINSAMISTRTNRALSFAANVGEGVGIYVSEDAGCPNFGFSNHFLEPYTKLPGSGSGEPHSELVTGIIRYVSPHSHIYCRSPDGVPFVTELNGVYGNPEILVANNSNGLHNNREYHLLDRDWDNLVYDHRVLTFISSGNNRKGDFEVETPGKGYNVVTVGNYDDNNDTIATDSSWVDSLLSNEKPEIVAPGVDISAVGHAESGTSLSSPHAAAMAANLMSLIPSLKGRPAQLKAMIMAGATKPIGGTDFKVGAGGIDFISTYYGGYGGERDTDGEYYQENPSYFTPINIRDSRGRPQSGRMRIVISWLNDGDYAYQNRHLGTQALAKDFDIRLYKNGSQIASSRSRDNSFEIIDIDLTGDPSDSYAYRIEQVRNSSTDARNILGYWINFYED